MSLQSWLQNSWLVQHTSSADEIKNLLAISDRDLAACQVKQLPADWRCAIAYNAALVLPIDAAVADRWGFLAADAKRKRKALSTIDALLAATALHYNLTIVSRNVSDFTSTQVPVLNPWEA
jgi:predicted nucleic acid-binding protein